MNTRMCFEHECDAVLTLHDAAALNAKGRKNVADWLRRQASDLMKVGDQYAGTMRARYYRRVRGQTEGK